MNGKPVFLAKLDVAVKVLISGATGLVGKALTKLLLKEGAEVHYLSRNKEKLRDEEKLKGFLWDPSAETVDPACFEGVNVVVNLAGAPISNSWTRSYKKRIVESRVSSLRTLRIGLEKAGNHELDYMVSASAIGIYPSSFTKYYSETETDYDAGFLGQTVQIWEESIEEFAGLGIPVGMLRIGLVLDSKEGALPKLVGPIRLFAGAPLGSGKQWQSWIHVNDLARMFNFALKNRLEGVFNAVAPNPVTNCKMTREAAEILEKPLWLPKIPAWGLKLALGQRAQLVLGSQRVSCEKIQAEGFSFDYPNLRPALEDLLS